MIFTYVTYQSSCSGTVRGFSFPQVSCHIVVVPQFVRSTVLMVRILNVRTIGPQIMVVVVL